MVPILMGGPRRRSAIGSRPRAGTCRGCFPHLNHRRHHGRRDWWVLSILSIPGAKRARLAAVSNGFSPRTAVLEMTRQNSLAFLIANIEKLFFRVHLARESASNDSAVDWPASSTKNTSSLGRARMAGTAQGDRTAHDPGDPGRVGLVTKNSHHRGSLT